MNNGLTLARGDHGGFPQLLRRGIENPLGGRSESDQLAESLDRQNRLQVDGLIVIVCADRGFGTAQTPEGAGSRINRLETPAGQAGAAPSRAETPGNRPRAAGKARPEDGKGANPHPYYGYTGF